MLSILDLASVLCGLSECVWVTATSAASMCLPKVQRVSLDYPCCGKAVSIPMRVVEVTSDRVMILVEVEVDVDVVIAVSSALAVGLFVNPTKMAATKLMKCMS